MCAAVCVFVCVSVTVTVAQKMEGIVRLKADVINQKFNIEGKHVCERV